MKRVRGRAARLVALGCVVAGAGAGFGYAFGSSSPQTINACYDKVNGNLRIDTDCRPNELPISWSSGAPIYPSGTVVDCTQGQSLQAAIDNAPPYGPYDITIKGTCRENVRLARDATSLDAAAAGDGIAAPDGNRPALAVQGRRVFLHGLTISGGFAGINVNGGFVNADHLMISGTNAGINAGSGGSIAVGASTIAGGQFGAVQAGQGGGSIQVFNSTLTGDGAHHADAVIASTGGTIQVQNSDVSGARHGVIAYPGGSVELENDTIHDNLNLGLFAFGGAINAHGGSVTNTTNTGASAYPGGYIDLADGIRIANNGSGVSTDGGRVLIQGGSIVENNAREGVTVQKDSSLTVEDGVIRNNGSFGVAIVDNSVASFSSTDVITGNGGSYQIFCNPAPASPLIVGPSVPAGTTTNCQRG